MFRNGRQCSRINDPLRNHPWSLRIASSLFDLLNVFLRKLFLRISFFRGRYFAGRRVALFLRLVFPFSLSVKNYHGFFPREELSAGNQLQSAEQLTCQQLMHLPARSPGRFGFSRLCFMYVAGHRSRLASSLGQERRPDSKTAAVFH